MPFGASRLAYLAKAIIAAAAGREVTITANGNAQIDSARSKFGHSSLLTDGTGDYLVAEPGTADDWIFSGEFTIEFFFQYDNDTGSATASLSSNRSGGLANTDYMILFRNFDTKIQIYCGPSLNVAVSSPALAADTWHHVALSRDSSNNLAFWVNGTREQLVTNVTYNIGASGRENVGIAAHADGGIAFNQGGNGFIDEFRISSIARYNTGGNITVPTSPFTNDDDTLLLMHMDGDDASTDFDDDEGSRARILVEASGNAKLSTATSQFGASSAIFDGTDDYITTENSSSLTFSADFTIEGWARSSSTGTIVSNRTVDATGFDTGTLTMERQGSGALQLVLNDSSNITSTATSDNTWFHWAIVRSGSTITFYVDGVSEGTSTNTATIGASTHNQLQFGCLGNAVGDYNGYIDEVRVSTTARYTSGFTPSTAAFENDEDTVMLLHMDGANNSTYFGDDNA